jgi:hypothetical protein
MKPRYDAYYRPRPAPGRQNADHGGGTAPRAAQASLPPVLRQPSVLEMLHPDIMQAITLLWGYPEMNTYFEKLWLDDGRGSPIAPEAMSELMLLAGVHRWLTPQRPVRNLASIYDASHATTRPRDVWDDTPRRR